MLTGEYQLETELFIWYMSRSLPEILFHLLIRASLYNFQKQFYACLSLIGLYFLVPTYISTYNTLYLLIWLRLRYHYMIKYK